MAKEKEDTESPPEWAKALLASFSKIEGETSSLTAAVGNITGRRAATTERLEKLEYKPAQVSAGKVSRGGVH